MCVCVCVCVTSTVKRCNQIPRLRALALVKQPDKDTLTFSAPFGIRKQGENPYIWLRDEAEKDKDQTLSVESIVNRLRTNLHIYLYDNILLIDSVITITRSDR